LIDWSVCDLRPVRVFKFLIALFTNRFSLLGVFCGLVRSLLFSGCLGRAIFGGRQIGKDRAKGIRKKSFFIITPKYYCNLIA
jgi:hypothetical protein